MSGYDWLSIFGEHHGKTPRTTGMDFEDGVLEAQRSTRHAVMQNCIDSTGPAALQHSHDHAIIERALH